MSTFRHLHQQCRELNEFYNDLSEKIKRLRDELAIETDILKRNQIEKQLKNIEIEREQIDKQIESIEIQLEEQKRDSEDVVEFFIKDTSGSFYSIEFRKDTDKGIHLQVSPIANLQIIRNESLDTMKLP